MGTGAYGSGGMGVVVGDGNGAFEVIGTNGSPTTPLVESFGTGHVPVIGSGSPTTPVANGLGTISGSGTPTTPVATAYGSLFTDVIGTGAATTPSVTSTSGRHYTVTIQHRPVGATEHPDMFAELISAAVYCEFSDSGDFDVTLYSDVNRFVSVTAYDSDNVVISAQEKSGHSGLRHSIMVVPRAGFYGKLFTAKVEKLVPGSGIFKYFGVGFDAPPVRGIDSEFIGMAGTTENGWD